MVPMVIYLSFAGFETVDFCFSDHSNHEETARLLGVSEKTVQRHWAFAKARLDQIMTGGSKKS